jgi:hypothetical protein
VFRTIVADICIDVLAYGSAPLFEVVIFRTIRTS